MQYRINYSVTLIHLRCRVTTDPVNCLHLTGWHLDLLLCNLPGYPGYFCPATATAFFFFFFTEEDDALLQRDIGEDVRSTSTAV